MPLHSEYNNSAGEDKKKYQKKIEAGKSAIKYEEIIRLLIISIQKNVGNKYKEAEENSNGKKKDKDTLNTIATEDIPACSSHFFTYKIEEREEKT